MTYHSSLHSCIYCKTGDIIVDATFGDAICRECGLVVSERMPSQEAEWREYEGDGEDTSHRARASKLNDYDDGMIFITGNYGTQMEKDLMMRIQSCYGTTGQKTIEKLSEVNELAYQLGIASQIKFFHEPVLYIR